MNVRFVVRKSAEPHKSELQEGGVLYVVHDVISSNLVSEFQFLNVHILDKDADE